MKSITRKQIQEINNKCSNNWNFDTIYFICHSEKTLIKKLKIDDTGYLENRLNYNNENQISLHISKFEYSKDKETAITSGMGKTAILDETQYKRKTLNNLIAHTEKLTDKELLKINSKTKVSTGDGLILQSEKF